MTIPEKEKISIKVQLKAVMQNRPYILALIGQVLFGFTLYGRNADILYYFTYVEEMHLIILLILCALLFHPLSVPHVFNRYSENLTIKEGQLRYLPF